MNTDKQQNDRDAPGVVSQTPCYARPRTRGELAEKLRAGTPCEVAGSAVSFTIIALRDWLNFDRFSVRPSENKGWCVFEA